MCIVTLEIVRILLTQQSIARFEIQRIVRFAESEIRCRHKIRHIAVIHKQRVAETVHFVCVDSVSGRIVDGCVMGKTIIDGMLQRRGTTGDFTIVKYVDENPLHISHDHAGEHVGRHEIWVDAGVVAGAESGPCHAGDGKRSSGTMVGHAVARIVIRTEEAVTRIRMVKLGFEHVKDSTDAAYKRIIEMAGGSCIAIQQPRQLNGVAQGVHLVFAFPQPWSERIGLIVRIPGSAAGFFVERVCVWIDIDEPELLPNKPGNKCGELGIIYGYGEIWSELR